MVTPVRDELRKRKEENRKHGGDSDGTIEVLEGGSQKGGKCLFDKILKLQWLTAHPFLVENMLMSNSFTPAQAEEIAKGLRELKGTSSLCKQMRDFHQNVTEQHTKQSASPQNHILDPTPAIFEPDAKFAMDKTTFANLNPQIQLAMGTKAEERKCHSCPKVSIPLEAHLLKPVSGLKLQA